MYDQLDRRLPPDINFSRKGFQRAVFLWQNRIMRRALAINGFRVKSLQRPNNLPKPLVRSPEDSSSTTGRRLLLNNIDSDPDPIDDDDEEN